MNEILGANETARCGNESKVTTATNKRMKREVKIPSIYMRYIRWAKGEGGGWVAADWVRGWGHILTTTREKTSERRSRYHTTKGRKDQEEENTEAPNSS